jgi:hypothetical protein
MALALIHHLAIAKNITFEQLASFFASICNVLVVEFVPKSDAKVKDMLNWREDIFDHYTEEEFERAFEKRFLKLQSLIIPGSNRTMFLYRKR